METTSMDLEQQALCHREIRPHGIGVLLEQEEQAWYSTL